MSLFLVLLAVIFVPLNQAFQVFNAGRTSIALQAAADATVKTVANELQGAIAVYPNSDLPGITDRSPYSSVPGTSYPPYYATAGCTAESARIANTTRIDFVLPARNADGTVANPVKAVPYLVTYYARRLNAYSSTKYPDGFDRFSNPICLFRAQMPYSDSTASPTTKLYTDDSRYSSCSTSRSRWLMHSGYLADDHPIEPLFKDPTDLNNSTTNLTTETGDGVQGSDTLISPRDMGIRVADTSTMRPDLNFQCEDTDGNGIIDRVTITMTLIQYEEGNSGRNGDSPGQRITASQVVNLPNTRLPV